MLGCSLNVDLTASKYLQYSHQNPLKIFFQGVALMWQLKARWAVLLIIAEQLTCCWDTHLPTAVREPEEHWAADSSKVYLYRNTPLAVQTKVECEKIIALKNFY